MAEKYDELADLAERGEVKVRTGTIRRGPEANIVTRDALLEATGASDADEAVELAVERPKTEEGLLP